MRTLILVAAVTVMGCGSNGAVTADNGVKACAVASACKLGGVSPSVSQCSAQVAGVNEVFAARAAGISAEEVNCLANAGKDCDAARRCFNDGQEPQACTGSSESCDGTKLKTCSTATGTGGNRATATFDCSQVGEMCVASGNTIGCGLGTCSGASTCQGDLLMQCDRGLLHSVDCGVFNSTCAVTLGIAHCRGKGPSCTGDTLNPFAKPLRCDGSALIYCFDGQEARFDCASEQTGCFANVKGQSYGCALGNECDPSTATTSCTGTVLSFCNNGKNAQLDCSKLGFTQCQAANGGSCS